jgi:cyclophilin family peptidyl-prolyl cis-trans isomerase
MSLFPRFALLLPVVVLPLAARAQSSLPTLTQPLPVENFAPGGAAVTVDLRNYFSIPGVTGQVAQFDTAIGKFNVELLANDAPKTVQNFLAYLNAGRYQNTFIHRAVSGFVVQGGGYAAALPITHIATFAAVPNEFKLPNLRGTLAMAKLGSDANSATSEWFVNLADNRANLDNQNGGFTVFARVLGTGMTIADAIAALPRYNIGFDAATDAPSTPLRNVPANETNLRVDYLVTLNAVSIVPLYPDDNATAAVLSFAAENDNASVVSVAVSGSTLTLTPLAAGTATLSIRAADTNGNVASSTMAVTVAAAASAPAITSQPVSRTVAPDSTVVFTVTATGSPAPAYQWYRGTGLPGTGPGALIAGATDATLVLSGSTGANAALAGTYSVVATNSEGVVTSAPATLTVTSTNDPGRLINLSILTPLQSGEIMTMGTVLGGAGTSGLKPLLVRAAGPALARFGVNDYLPDPAMTLNTTTTDPATVVASNGDWAGAESLTAAFSSVGAFPYVDSSSKDAAIFQPNLSPGQFTVQVGDASGGRGTVIAELYDGTAPGTFSATTPRLINVSVRKQIGTGSTLTVGFVIGGSTSRTVLLRAIGPGLLAFGVSGVMADPTMTLTNISASPAVTVAANNNWGGTTPIADAARAVGAFAIGDTASKDAIILATLAPGNYTAQVSAVGTGGTAIVEVYEVP